MGATYSTALAARSFLARTSAAPDDQVAPPVAENRHQPEGGGRQQYCQRNEREQQARARAEQEDEPHQTNDQDAPSRPTRVMAQPCTPKARPRHRDRAGPDGGLAPLCQTPSGARAAAVRSGRIAPPGPSCSARHRAYSRDRLDRLDRVGPAHDPRKARNAALSTIATAPTTMAVVVPPSSQARLALRARRGRPARPRPGPCRRQSPRRVPHVAPAICRSRRRPAVTGRPHTDPLIEFAPAPGYPRVPTLGGAVVRGRHHINGGDWSGAVGSRACPKTPCEAQLVSAHATRMGPHGSRRGQRVRAPPNSTRWPPLLPSRTIPEHRPATIHAICELEDAGSNTIPRLRERRRLNRNTNSLR